MLTTNTPNTSFKISPKTVDKLNRYSNLHRLTHPSPIIDVPSAILGKSSKVTYREKLWGDTIKASSMPKKHIGACWIGSALCRGASSEVKNTLPTNDFGRLIGIVADAYLLARRTEKKNVGLILSKLAGGYSAPAAIFPIEGTFDVDRCRRVMKQMLLDNDVDIEKLKKLNFRHLDCGHLGLSTPMRNYTSFTSILPKNTIKNREYFYSLSSNHAELGAILADRNNLVSNYDDDSLNDEAKTFTEDGWRKIIANIIMPTPANRKQDFIINQNSLLEDLYRKIFKVPRD